MKEKRFRQIFYPHF